MLVKACVVCCRRVVSGRCVAGPWAVVLDGTWHHANPAPTVNAEAGGSALERDKCTHAHAHASACAYAG